MVKRTQIIVLLMVAVALSAGAQSQTGLLSYFENDVAVIRDGEYLESSDLAYGEAIYVHDVVQTGADSYAEIELTSPHATGSTIRVNEDSSYYVEFDGENDGAGDTRIRLLTGSVEIAVDQLRPGSRFSVQTNTAVLGVRGTTFDVITAPDDATLLGVREGTVVLVSQGGSIRAEAGSAVEATPSGEPTLSPVPNGDFESFYNAWEETRREVFRSGAPVFVTAYVRRYRESADDFDAAFRELAPFRDQLLRSLRSTPSMGETATLKMEIGPAMIRARSILPRFESTVYRLRELQRYHRQGIGVTTIDGESSADFFRTFSMVERRLLVQLSTMRQILDLYAQLDAESFGGMPGGSGIPQSNAPGNLGGFDF